MLQGPCRNREAFSSKSGLAWENVAAVYSVYIYIRPDDAEPAEPEESAPEAQGQ